MLLPSRSQKKLSRRKKSQVVRNLKLETLKKKIKGIQASTKSQDTIAGVEVNTSNEAVVEAEVQKKGERKAQAKRRIGITKKETTEIEEIETGKRTQRGIRKEIEITVAEIEKGIVAEKGTGNVSVRRKGRGLVIENVKRNAIGIGMQVAKETREDLSIKTTVKEGRGTNETGANDILI